MIEIKVSTTKVLTIVRLVLLAAALLLLASGLLYTSHLLPFAAVVGFFALVQPAVLTTASALLFLQTRRLSPDLLIALLVSTIPLQQGIANVFVSNAELTKDQGVLCCTIAVVIGTLSFAAVTRALAKYK